MQLLRDHADSHLHRHSTVSSSVTSTTVAIVSNTDTATAVVTDVTTVPVIVNLQTTVTLVALTVTSTTTTTEVSTSTITSVVPSTTTIGASYMQAFSGSGCVYNEYTNFFVLAAPNFASAEQQCACNCNKDPACKSFFIYYSSPDGNFAAEYDCTTDNAPYNSAFTQCGLSFAAQAVAYNKVA